MCEKIKINKGGFLPMDYELKGKKVMITGAAQGIGKETAIVFAKQKADIIACDINLEKLKDSCLEFEQYGIRTLPIKMDVGDEESVKEGVAKAIDEIGRIDVLLNCAGVVISRKLFDLEEKEWERVMSIDLKSVFMLGREVAKHMVENKIHGRIITVSSQASKIGEYANGVYSCAKAGINTLTQVMAQEWAEYGITVNAVCPGYVNTELMRGVFEKRGPLEGMTPEQYKKKLCDRIPLGRMAEGRDVGELMAFLASPGADYITGVAITIAGGSTLF